MHHRGVFTRPKRVIGLVAVAALGTAALGGRPIPQPSSANPSQEYTCIAQPSDRRELAFAVTGKVEELFVAPGDRVRPGQMLMKLDDVLQRQTTELARMQADDPTPVQIAEVTLAFRAEDLDLTLKARQKDGTSDAQVRQAHYEHDMAGVRLDAAKREAEANKLAWEREKARLDQMHLTSPMDGIVLEVLRRPGEAVDELTAVLTVVRTDPLWVEVNVPMGHAAGLSVGQTAQIEWDDIEGVGPMTGRVIFKSPVGDAGAREVLLRVEVPNPDGLPTGLHGRLRFLPGDTPEVLGSSSGTE